MLRESREEIRETRTDLGGRIDQTNVRLDRLEGEMQSELTRLLERPVHLFLFVKVRENWIEDPERYAALGLDYNV